MAIGPIAGSARTPLMVGAAATDPYAVGGGPEEMATGGTAGDGVGAAADGVGAEAAAARAAATGADRVPAGVGGMAVPADQ